MRWLKNIVVISSILLLFYQWAVANEQSAEDTAKTQYEQFKTRAGKSDTLRKNFINPLLGGGNLKTIDLSQEGQAQIACPSSKEFLTVMIRPKATGDFDADIYWDSNLDNKMDKSMTVNGISGVCANGFIICAPGTWQNCKDYTFEYNNGDLIVKETYITELSGCFCINSSCGSNLLWNNLGYVVKLFGGAVASAFQKADPRYSISDSLIDGPAIYFYGQKTRDCSLASVQGVSRVRDLEKYKNSPALISGDMQSEILTQSSDPNSLYYNMYFHAQNGTQEQKFCSITRAVTETLQNVYKPCPNNPTTVIGGWDANGESRQCFYDFHGCRMLSSSDSSWESCYSKITGQGNLLNLLNESIYAGTGYIAARIDSMSVSGRANLSGCFGADDDAYDVSITINATCQHEECNPIPLVNNTCTNFDSDPSCVLWDEKIDGVPTIRDRVRTGLRPLPQCVIACGETHCYDFLRVERTYLCSSQPMDLSFAKQRLATVVPTSQYDGTNLTFTDTRYENGRWANYPNQIFHIQRGQLGEDCEKACKVRVSMKNTQVGTGDPLSNVRSGASYQDYVYYYRACYNDQCPVDAGEELVTPCQCTQDFAGAASVMQSLRLAGQDIICSSGNIKALPGH
jgi:hypothetical protein